MCVRPSPQVLLLPALNLFIDGASDNVPFACSSLPAVHVRRARHPNARLELWPVPRASVNEVRQLVMLVAIAPVYASEDPLSVEDLVESSVHVTLPQEPPLHWEGVGGGDDRLRKLVPLLRGMSNPWPIVSTHLPGRSGRECRERWTKLVQSAEGAEGSTLIKWS